MFLYTAFILGLAGSFHCIGMCGPIALALPVKQNSSRVFSILVYNIGRIFTYALIGSVVGLIGAGLAIAGMQQNISIAVGVLILFSLLLPAVAKKILPENTKIFSLVGAIKIRFAVLFKQKTYSALFFIGMLNGLLPCGFVYIALAGSALAASITESILYMALFGFGTLPMMMGISYLPGLLNNNGRKKMKRLMPVFTFLFAVLFIVRGLNIGIPYLSPRFNATSPLLVKCCTK